MNPKIHDFAASHLKTKKRREKVLDSWMMFRHIKPPLDQVRKKIWRYKIAPYLVFGKRYRVIHPKLAKKLSGEKCKSLR